MLLIEQLENEFPNLTTELARLLPFVLLRVLEESSSGVEAGDDHNRGRVVTEVDILHAHLCQEHGHLAEQRHHPLLLIDQAWLELGRDLVGVGLMEIKVCHEVNIVIEEVKDFFLLVEDVFGWDCLVSDLLGDYL